MGEICWHALCRIGLSSRVMDHLSGFILVITWFFLVITSYGLELTLTTRVSLRSSSVYTTSISLACAAISLTVHLLPCYRYREHDDRSEGLAASLKCTIFYYFTSIKRLGTNVTIRARANADTELPSTHLLGTWVNKGCVTHLTPIHVKPLKTMLPNRHYLVGK